jgi:hypothetical protein
VSACLQRERACARSCARNGTHFTRMCMSKSEWLNRSPVSFDVTCVRVRAETHTQFSAQTPTAGLRPAGAKSLQAIQLRSLTGGRAERAEPRQTDTARQVLRAHARTCTRTHMHTHAHAHTRMNAHAHAHAQPRASAFTHRREHHGEVV